jgi:hypothetical protein
VRPSSCKVKQDAGDPSSIRWMTVPAATSENTSARSTDAEANKSRLIGENTTPVTVPVLGDREPTLLWDERSQTPTVPAFSICSDGNLVCFQDGRTKMGVAAARCAAADTRDKPSRHCALSQPKHVQGVLGQGKDVRVGQISDRQWPAGRKCQSGRSVSLSHSSLLLQVPQAYGTTCHLYWHRQP